MVVVIDPQVAGVSGDMMLCSLVDLGADEDRVINAIRRSEEFLPGSSVRELGFRRVTKNGIRAVSLVLDVDEDVRERTGAAMRLAVANSVDTLEISKDARSFAASCIDSLIQAESRIHGTPEDSVHLHEASSFDTVADIVGVAVALDGLGVFDDDIVCLPIAVGGGTVKFSHGTTSNPAPAILEILRGSGLAIAGSPAGGETTTPTGACILANLAKKSAKFYPPMTVASIGYGAGKKDFEGFANVLKVVRGTSGGVGTDSVTILETNVDDVSGEVLGNMIERVMKDGALDASIYPGITKKGRPTSLVSVMCRRMDVERIVGTMVSETGTLGVRVFESARLVVPRTLHSISVSLDGITFQARFKRSTFKGRSSFKIEFDDLKTISEAVGKPIKETETLIRREIEGSEA